MAKRKNTHAVNDLLGLVVLQIYTPSMDNGIALWIEDIMITYGNVFRVKLPGEEDPLFMIIDDEYFVYDGIKYSDISVSSYAECKTFLKDVGWDIVPFDPKKGCE